MFIKVDKFIFPVDFVVLDIEKPWDTFVLIFGQSFLSTSRAIMDFEAGNYEQEKFKIHTTIEKPSHEVNSKKVKDE